MDNFDYQGYLKNNRLLKEEDDREDDELSPEELANKHAGSPMREESTKLKVSELKAKIKKDIMSLLQEADEDVDVDIEGDNMDIDIEDGGVDATIEVGLSPEEELIQDSLKAAMDASNALGNDKLSDQIGNTITFFTREYVVGRNNN